ncbi:hypothetical protein M427DRAFT_158187 [Gonapodya prolifera JEL478]|uniref:Mediator of RNA polymerase II transcription subunit 20 n=1 Tax=Gonapodya prolifera (strain JEL478) TaxID=1344416 RepID=A0A139A3Y2_GONPJ|nr:hypothetical protein M427DRAFT_158187 [Gonapodya prolifera JEL478]|eukprot:KXS11424.1 hypothetical protein M427DRAFT_158187 [Gonapodya prolifera JEL478]
MPSAFVFVRDTRPDATSFLQDRIVRLYDARHVALWSATCKIFRPGPIYLNAGTDQNKTLLLLQSPTLWAERTFSLIGGSVFAGAGAELETIIARSKNIWQHRQTCAIAGETLEFGDGSVVRMGAVTVGPTLRGYIIEVGGPHSTPADGASIIARVLPRTTAPRSLTELDLATAKLDPDTWTDAHTAYGYLCTLAGSVL